MIRGLNVIGTDINPLAHLIAIAKTTPIELAKVDLYSRKFEKSLSKFADFELPNNFKITGIRDLDFWFKPDVVKRLLYIKNFINSIENDEIRLFFKVAFSETVRESSNTRNGEFKLFRYEKERLEAFNPDVFGIMLKKISRNRKGLNDFDKAIEKLEIKSNVSIHDFNTVFKIPTDAVAPRSVDIVVTSPPYGDSRKTVAYGQLSRLSSAWLDLPNPEKIDSKLTGGKPKELMAEFPSHDLNTSIKDIEKQDTKRAKEITAFYSDLFSSIKNVAKTMKRRAYACYVIANRKVGKRCDITYRYCDKGFLGRLWFLPHRYI